jgi:NhaP-type Na+/H+ or K+/H+ antiporter
VVSSSVALTQSQLSLGITLIFAVAMLCQVVAPRLRVPALVLLLPAGFVLGILVPGANPMAILGSSFSPVVDLVVAIILFQGGMELGKHRISKADGHTVLRLVWIGGALTWASATLLAAYIIGLPFAIAVLLGAIVTVSGPTVVNPLLDVVRPKKRVRSVLQWEGTLLDPIGALTAVIVFQAIKAGEQASLGESIAVFVFGLVAAAIIAAIGLVLMRVGLRIAGDNRPVLGTQVLLGTVILASGLANVVTDDVGLLTALLMGIGVAKMARTYDKDVGPVRPFFDIVVNVAIGVLFVGLSTLVTPESVAPLVLPTLGVIAILILVVRPGMVLLMTMRKGFSMRERLFIGWMAPRGIVAAATAASTSTTLIALKVDGAHDLLPVTFMIIAGTVFVYGLTAVPMARLLGLRDDGSPAAADVTES